MALKITFIVLAILALAIIAFCFIFCEIERKKLFPRRCGRNEYTLQDRPLTDFKNMQYKDFSFYSKKSILRGRFYFKDNLENNDINNSSINRSISHTYGERKGHFRVLKIKHEEE